MLEGFGWYYLQIMLEKVVNTVVIEHSQYQKGKRADLLKCWIRHREESDECCCAISETEKTVRYFSLFYSGTILRHLKTP
ncbi:MAG: hypothetical protein CSA33_04035 [Desulfobulbus propionicus]|nr:MAG: hypothetical protein CSA33_04035 [Desulfobulbus propionicus]